MIICNFSLVFFVAVVFHFHWFAPWIFALCRWRSAELLPPKQTTFAHFCFGKYPMSAMLHAWESVADTVSFSSVINSYLDNDLVSAIIESNAKCSGRSVTLALDAIFCLSFFFRRNFIFLCFSLSFEQVEFPITRFLISVCHRCTFVHFQHRMESYIIARIQRDGKYAFECVRNVWAGEHPHLAPGEHTQYNTSAIPRFPHAMIRNNNIRSWE